MGHKDAGVYQAYINERVQADVEAAFLGRPSDTALFNAISHTSRYVDPRAPTDLNASESDIIKANPEVVHYQELRDTLS